MTILLNYRACLLLTLTMLWGGCLQARGLHTHATQDLQELYQELKEQASTVSNLEELPPSDSIVKLTNGTKYAIVIWDTKTLKDKATFNALLSVSIPGDNQKLLFYGEQIGFSNKAGIKGKVKLKLVQDVSVMKGQVLNLTFRAKDTYAEIDCKGFDKMTIGLDLEFSKDHILKENPDGSISSDRVKTSLTLQMKDFSDFLTNITLPTFQVRGIKDLSFTASQVYLDFSDYANPPNLPLDIKYDSIFRVDSTAKLWQGVYLGQVSIKLPRFLKKDKSGDRIEIGASSMVIDEQGFTGSVFAGGLVGLNNGNLGKWAFSLDQLGVVLQKSEMQQGYFKGKIKVPIGKDKDTLGYKCSIGTDGTYGFKVNTLTTMSFPILKADTVKLLPNSALTITVKNDTVKIRANLSGSMNISAPIGDDGDSNRFQVGNLGFEGLEIANYSPELAIKAIQYSSADPKKSPQLSKFPLNISKIRLSSEGKTLQLGIELMLNLNAKFGAGGGIVLHGKITEQEGKVKYEFDRTSLDAFKVNVTVTKFKLKGVINVFDKDPEFGNGFKGNIDMELSLTENKDPLKLAVGALFGKIRTHRYWFVDASASGFSLPVFTGVNITGFAGGAYEGMNKTFTGKNPLGKTISGQMYLPDSTAGMGFQAGVTLAIPKSTTFTGRLLLELAFNKSGGLRRIFFLGEGECMASSGAMTNLNKLVANVNKINPLPTDQQAKAASDGLANDIPIVKHFSKMDQAAVSDNFGSEQKSKDMLKMSLMVDLNFETDELTANFKPYISVGNGAIMGTKGGGLAGEGDLYFGPDKWYINLGKPSNRIEISVLKMATFSSYFMIGTDIEGSPAPPVEIAQILNMDASKLDYMRDMNALGNGAGIAFGSAMKIETGEKQFLLFYYRITAGAGFDIMLKDYGNNAYCVGRPGPLGVNGWYANGQAYAYFQGSVGIQVNLAFTKGRFEVLSVGAAALLQAKLPNPTWMRGIVGGRYSILNGLVKGNCRIEVELGEECVPAKTGGALDNVTVIAQLTPDNNKTDVSVFAKPQAVFNIPINETFSIEDPMYPGTFKKYRAVLQTLDVRLKTQDKVLGELQWNDDKTTVAFKSTEILSPQKDFIFNVIVDFEQEVNGTWQAYKDDKGQSQTERKDVSFKTGDAPDNIPVENLQFTYPALSHKNFYKGMTPTGYIQLIQGQAYLFTDPKFSPSIVVTDHRGSKTEIPVKYDISKKNVIYNLPSLQTDKIYTLSLENMPKDRNASIDKNVSTQSKDVLTATSDTGSTTTLNTKLASGVVEEVQGKVLLSYPFRTSFYETLQAKIASNKVEGSYFNSVDYQGYALGARISQPKEAFDASEMDADQNLLSFEVNFKNHAWFTTKLKGYMYQNYPILSSLKVDRDTALAGFIPTRDVTFTQTLPTENLTDDEVSAGLVNPAKSTYTLTGNFHRTMYQDFYQIRTRIASLYSKGIAVGNYANMLTDAYPGLNRDRGFVYPVEVYYWLPWEKTKRKVSTLNVVLD